jgi:uncharacterized membrane protein
MNTLRVDSSGFRLRGLQATRIETFTDAAFAFSLTLLVISLEPPTSLEALRIVLQDVPAFLLSATQLMLFWWGHHEWSRRYGLDDGMTLMLSCLLVFTVLVYVYPLRFMFGVTIAWLRMLAGIPMGRDLGIGAPEDVNGMFVIYGMGFVAMAGALLLLHFHAWRRREALGLDDIELHETRATIGAWAILGGTALASVLMGLLAPPTLIGLPGWPYATLGFVMPLYGKAMTRRRPDRIPPP